MPEKVNIFTTLNNSGITRLATNKINFNIHNYFIKIPRMKLLNRTILFILFTIIMQKNSLHAANDTINIKDGLSLQLIRSMNVTIFTSNPVETALASGTWKSPKAGEKVRFNDTTERIWKKVLADEKGWIVDSVRGGSFIYVQVQVKNGGIMLLQLMGNDMVYVNGSPRAGNPYGTSDTYNSWENDWNFVTLPVTLKKGKNELLFRCQRGKMKARLYPAPKECYFMNKDFTLPNFLVSEKIDTWGGIVIINASVKAMKDLYIRTKVGDNAWYESEISTVQPTCIRKLGFMMKAEPIVTAGSVSVFLELVKKSEGHAEVIDKITIPVTVVQATANHKETFISQIDGSVQYYSVLPPRNYDRKSPVALFLSVHGAGVEAINQTGSYYPKTWGMVVSPTNRRPYGFNWEDWGRLDAMEVLDIAEKKFNIDQSRVYLTGHSMGGHGAWHLGAMFPDRFAAIGPSAGWISFWSYRFRGQNLADTSAIKKMIRRSTTPSETMTFAENYKQFGVYVIHGEIDDNVRIDQAKMMLDRLKEIDHKDYQYHFEPGANHWWDVSDESGADCVDWAPLFDFFARHARPGKERIRQIDFITSDPGVSARNNWLVVDAQQQQLSLSEVHVLFDPSKHRFTGTTKNVARLAFDLDILPVKDTLRVKLDNQTIANIKIDPKQEQVWLEKENDDWKVASKPAENMKNSLRYGTFKEAFRNRMVFVFGTNGTPDENQWAFDKARYDAEKFWYQGNGGIELIADKDFKPEQYSQRSVILYGNRKTNLAWNSLLSDSPVQVENGFITLDGEKYAGSNLACMFVRPRVGCATASIGVVSGSGLLGMNLTTRLPYMNPGIGLPDCTVMSSEMLTKGDQGVMMTGFFGLDWSIKNGDFIWNVK